MSGKVPVTSASVANAPIMVAAVQAQVRVALPIDRYVFDAAKVTGYSETDGALSAYQQSIFYTVPSTGNGASVAVYAPGRLRISPGHAAPVTVAGRPGYFGSLRVRLADVLGNDAFPTSFPASYLSRTVTILGTLAWQYQPDAWALVYSRGAEVLPISLPPTTGDAARFVETPLTRHEELRMAEAIHPRPGRLVKVPARFTKVPHGLVLQRIGFFSGGTAGAFYQFGSARTGPATLLVDVNNNPGTGTNRGIPVTVGAFHGRYVRGSRRPVLYLIDRPVEIDFAIPEPETGTIPGIGFSLARLSQLAAHMVIAHDITDSTTWFEASTATR